MVAHGLLKPHKNKQIKTWAKHIVWFEANWKHAWTVVYLFGGARRSILGITFHPNNQCRSQPKNREEGKKFGGTKIAYFRLTIVFCLEYRLPKHKMTRYFENLWVHDPLGPPGYAHVNNFVHLRLCQHSQGVQVGSLCRIQLKPSKILVSPDILRLF